MTTKFDTELRGLRAKAELFDELVEQLASAETEFVRLRRQHTREGIDPAWRLVANELAEALRPYSLFREQRVEEGRIVVETRVPGSTLTNRPRRWRGSPGRSRWSPTTRAPSRLGRTRSRRRSRRGRVGAAVADPLPGAIFARLRRAAPGGQRARNGRAHLRSGGSRTMSDQTHHTVTGVRFVALSRVSPGEQFNPRTRRDPDRFAQLVASVKADGVLQPLLVTPEGDGFRIVAGEGRWLAAGEASLSEVPVHVVQVDEQTGGLELAMAENLARQDLDPVQEAHGYDRLRAAGLTKKGIAERLGIAQKRVTERLELLKLPAALHGQIASGQIPPAAIKPLVAVERTSAGLAECAVARIDAPSKNSWEEPLSWADLVADPLNILTASVDGPGCELPDGVYDASEPLPVAPLPLSETARTQLDELCGLLGHDPAKTTMQIGREALERATALKAAHATKSGWSHLIVGEDIVAELAADHIAACLKQHHERVEREAANPPYENAVPDPEAVEDGVDAEEHAKQQRRAEREQAQRDKQSAIAHNMQLGSSILKQLPRLKVDAEVLKVLTTVEVAGDLDGVTARGARYCFPGWPQETTQKNGKAKVVYLDKTQAASRAREFLAGASSPAEIAGRLFCLIAAARYADERCVAQSNRSFASLKVRDGLPYSGEVLDLIDELCQQRLPEHLTAPVRDARREQREASAAHEANLAEARERLDAALGNLGGLSEEQREQALVDVDTVHGRYSLDGHRLRKQLEPANAPDAPADAAHDAEAA